jgi:RNA polymerase sigma-70 factor (ECF subfamily)
LTPCEDALWIDETLEGNLEAFGHLVEKYQDRLFRSMLAISDGREEALDVVQEALTQAMLKLHTFQRRSDFYTWLYRIAYNLALASRRWKKKERRALEAVHGFWRISGPSAREARDRPERRLERQECRRQVQEALARLDEAYSTVVVLRKIDGLSYEEISLALDLPKGTVRSRLHRARVQLLRMLEGSLR